MLLHTDFVQRDSPNNLTTTTTDKKDDDIWCNFEFPAKKYGALQRDSPNNLTTTADKMDDDIGFRFKFPALERGTGTALQGAQNFGLETRGLGRFIQQLCLLTRKSAIKIALL